MRLLPLLLILATAACSMDLGSARAKKGRNGTEEDVNATETTKDDPAMCTSQAYKGFGGRDLAGRRAAANIGVDRGRVKPFSALKTEYARVLGVAPASLEGADATFGLLKPRWLDEPQGGAIALTKASSIAFDGCLDYTRTAPEFGNAPDAASAKAQCSAMARKFWSKVPTPQEIEACESVAITGSATETQPRRRWAYACATVLTSAQFLTY